MNRDAKESGIEPTKQMHFFLKNSKEMKNATNRVVYQYIPKESKNQQKQSSK